jgi:UDP-perosamine 4-acetyltransferase
MSLPVIILAGGGHARVLIEALRRNSVRILGLTDPDPALQGRHLDEIPILGGDDSVRQYAPDQISPVNGMGSVGVPSARARLFELFVADGYRFVPVVHPAATVASAVVLGEGAQIMAGAIIQPGCRIGANAIINTGAIVDHDCSIGDHVHIAPGVTLSGGVSVGSGSHIGTAASVIQGIRIGSDCLVGAGALVVRDVPPRCKVMGVPAREVV